MMKNKIINEVFLNFYLKKQGFSENTYLILKKSKIFKDLQKEKVPVFYLLNIAKVIEAGLTIKKLKQILKDLKKMNYPTWFIDKNENNSKIILYVIEGKNLLDPSTEQYLLNFNFFQESNKSEVINVNSVYRLVLKYFHKNDYQKVWEYSDFLIKALKYNHTLQKGEILQFYEIYTNTVLTIKKPIEAYQIFKKLYLELEQPFFLKQMGIVLFLSKHYKLSLNYFYKYYNVIRQMDKEKVLLNNNEEEKIMLLIQIIKSILIINKKNSKKLKLIKK
jgi:hypothetical protein